MNNEVHNIELSIEQARSFVKAADALNRLFANPDFVDIIKVGYFKDEPARLVEMKASPQMAHETHQANIIKSIDGIGALQQYFNTIWAFGTTARETIESGEAMLAELATEETN